jgi:hypothetical protein
MDRYTHSYVSDKDVPRGAKASAVLGVGCKVYGVRCGVWFVECKV